MPYKNSVKAKHHGNMTTAFHSGSLQCKVILANTLDGTNPHCICKFPKLPRWKHA